MRCVIHGSFRRHFDEIMSAHELLTKAGVEVLAPETLAPTGTIDGFVLLEGQDDRDPRSIELDYLHDVKRLGSDGFSLFVCPGGALGLSASYELAVAQLFGVRCFTTDALRDHPAFVPAGDVIAVEDLAATVAETGALPPDRRPRREHTLRAQLEDLVLPGSVIAVGAMIERRRRGQTEVLAVRTHKWGDRWSMVGGKVRRGERLGEALARETHEETSLRGRQGQHLATFDQLKGSGYFRGHVNHVFVDYVFEVDSRRVRLNDEAQEFCWGPATELLRDLDFEPNARHTFELYAAATAWWILE